MEYIVINMQQNKMKCKSTKRELNNLSWNSKSPSSNTMKCHGPSKPQALLTSTRLVSTFKNIIQDTLPSTYPKLASSASWPSSSIAFFKPIKSSNYLQAKLNDIAKPIWEGSWNHSTWNSLSSQTSTQSLSTKFVIYIILINAIQEFINKENDKLQRIEKVLIPNYEFK